MREYYHNRQFGDTDRAIPWLLMFPISRGMCKQF